MNFKKLLITLLSLGVIAQANSCPKWLTLPANDLVVVVPIYDATVTGADLDCDGIVDKLDKDIDGDGVANTKDAFPLNSAETVDSDGDGIGNNADADDDNDGISDSDEIAQGTNPLSKDTDGDGAEDAEDDYPTDPDQTIKDTIAPVITLAGDNPQIIELGSAYEELGATTDDNSTVEINTTALDITQVGTYTVTYSAVDQAGNVAESVVRTVKIENPKDTVAPVITLAGDNPQIIELGNRYEELGATTDDNSTVEINATALDITQVGTYTVTYSAVDQAGNVAESVVRTVNIVSVPENNITCACEPIKDVNLSEEILLFFSKNGGSIEGKYVGASDDLIIADINKTNETIYLAMYDFTNKKIRDALIDAKARGVEIKIVTDDKQWEDKADNAYGDLSTAGISVIGINDKAIMHNKILILDEKILWIGSANYTYSAFYTNYEHTVRIQNDALIAEYKTQVQELLNDEQVVDEYHTEKYELFFSPEDDFRAKRLVSLAENAQKSIYIMAFAFNDSKLRKAVVDAKDRGVDVHVIMDAKQTVFQKQWTQYDELLEAGIDIKLMGDGHHKIHHKVIVIDGEMALTGSYNFTTSANTKNNENSLIIHDTKIAEQYIAKFYSIYNEAVPPALDGSAMQVFFSTQKAYPYLGGSDDLIIRDINASQTSVSLAIYDFTNKKIRDVLIAVKERGVSVEVVTDDKHVGKGIFKELADANIPIYSDEEGSKGLMHDKILIIDKEIVWMGSANYTYYSFYNNYEHTIRITDSYLVNAYDEQFAEIKSNTLVAKAYAHENYALYFSPEDNFRSSLFKLIEDANSTIHIMMFAIADSDLGDLLVDAHKRGVEIHIVADEGQNDYQKTSQVAKLKQAGIDIKLDGSPYKLHNKVMVVDKKIVVTGSYNFTKSANTINYENSLVVNNVDFAQSFLDEFCHIYAEAQ